MHHWVPFKADLELVLSAAAPIRAVRVGRGLDHLAAIAAVIAGTELLEGRIVLVTGHAYYCARHLTQP